MNHPASCSGKNACGTRWYTRYVTPSSATKTTATAHRTLVDEWRVLTAATLVGVGAGALALGVEYATHRRQFGVRLRQRFVKRVVGPLGVALFERLVPCRCVNRATQRQFYQTHRRSGDRRGFAKRRVLEAVGFERFEGRR